MTFTLEQVKMLEAKLDGAHVKPPPQGKHGSYVEGWRVINEANRIFGFGGWSYALDKIRKTNAFERDSKHFVGYMAVVTVTAGGVSRQDVGHGSGINRNLGDAHEGATKEAVTDALKRALRTFGNPFGLALYDKSGENVERSNGATRPSPKPYESRLETAANPAWTDKQGENLVKQIKAIASGEELDALTADADFKALFKRLPGSWRDSVTEAGKQQRAKFSQTGLEAG